MSGQKFFFKGLVSAIFVLAEILQLTALSIFGTGLLIYPLLNIDSDYASLFVSLPLGVMMLSFVLIACFVAPHFDKQYKNTLEKDEFIDDKLPLAFLPARWLIKFKLLRGAIYARNIVFQKNAYNNMTQQSWFNGYNFRKNARWIDKIFSFLWFGSFICIILGCVVYAIITYS